MLLIKNGKVHVGNGEVLENYDILIKEGKIINVSKDIKEDVEITEIIDVTGMDVFPGFIDPTNNTGARDNTFSIKDIDEFSNPVTINSDIKYSFNPDEVMMEELYKVGITAIGVTPGDCNVIGGKMAAFRTHGYNVNKMLIKEFVGLKGSVSHNVKETYGKRNILKTKMGIFALLIDVLKNNKEGEEKEIIDKVLNKEVPLFITAKTKAEIDALINIVKDYDINLVLCNAYQAEKCIESIKEVNASVIMGEQIYLSKNVYNNIDLSKLVEMKTGNNAIGFTVTGDYGPSGKVKYLWNVARLYQSGIDSEEVVKMMTYYPAKMLGIDNIIGTIEAGKDADITIYSNNPIKYYDARNKYTIIQGKIVYKEGGCEKCC